MPPTEHVLLTETGLRVKLDVDLDDLFAGLCIFLLFCLLEIVAEWWQHTPQVSSV